MNNKVALHIWGKYASFKNQEGTTYLVPTPSALRGILEAIYWKPQFKWIVDTLVVKNEIKTMKIVKNEIKTKMSKRKRIYIEDKRTQNMFWILKDVDYMIYAHQEMKDEFENKKKHLEIFKRRAEKGQCFHRPYFGNREFPVYFMLEDLGSESNLSGKENLGRMLYDFDYIRDNKGPITESNEGLKIRPVSQFFNAIMTNGIIDIPKIK